MTMLTTPTEISRFQLVAQRAAVKLEKLGMRNSHGNITPKLRKHFGLSARAPHQEVIDKINEKIAEFDKAATL